MSRYTKLPTSSSHVSRRSSLKPGSDKLTPRDYALIAKARREEEAPPEYTGLKLRLYERNQRRLQQE